MDSIKKILFLKWPQISWFIMLILTIFVATSLIVREINRNNVKNNIVKEKTYTLVNEQN